jgi:hypothetical protein
MELLEDLLRCRDEYEKNGLFAMARIVNDDIDTIITAWMPKRTHGSD